MNDISKKTAKAGDLQSTVGAAWEGISDTMKNSASTARDYATDTIHDGSRRAVRAGGEAANALSTHVRQYPVMSAVLFLGGLLVGSLLVPRR